jgi:Pyridine nucleotide-disulphide oxidoreductase/Cation efflux family
VVIGAGWIGLETAAAARAADAQVTLLEHAELPLLAVLGPQLARVFADLHTDHGVDLRCNVAVTAIRPGHADPATAGTVLLADGTELPADVSSSASASPPTSNWAGSFFALAAYVTVEAVRSLLGAGEADRLTIGIVLVSISVVIMPVLSWAQRRAGRELGSASAVADSRQTLLCTYLSAAVLLGLLLNAAFGWWWADPAAALVLAVLAVREGRNAWRGEVCCSPRSLPARDQPAGCDDGCVGRSRSQGPGVIVAARVHVAALGARGRRIIDGVPWPSPPAEVSSITVSFRPVLRRARVGWRVGPLPVRRETGACAPW